MIEAAQGCGEGVERVAFLRHLSDFCPPAGTTHSPWGPEKRELRAVRALVALVLPAAAHTVLARTLWPGGVSRLLLPGGSGTFPHPTAAAAARHR